MFCVWHTKWREETGRLWHIYTITKMKKDNVTGDLNSPTADNGGFKKAAQS